MSIPHGRWVWLTLPQIRAQVRQGFDAAGNGVFREMPRKVALRRWVDFVRANGA